MKGLITPLTIAAYDVRRARQAWNSHDAGLAILRLVAASRAIGLAALQDRRWETSAQFLRRLDRISRVVERVTADIAGQVEGMSTFRARVVARAVAEAVRGQGARRLPC